MPFQIETFSAVLLSDAKEAANAWLTLNTCGFALEETNVFFADGQFHIILTYHSEDQLNGNSQAKIFEMPVTLPQRATG